MTYRIKLTAVTIASIALLLLLSASFVEAQSPRVPQQEPGPDGGLVHVVNFGDTLASILAAYAPYGVTIESLQELNGWRFPPQFIYVDDQIVILPPGSVAAGNGIPAAPAIAPGGAAPDTAPADAPDTAPDAAPAASGDAVAPPAASDPSAAPTPEAATLTMDEIVAITPVEAVAPFLP